MTGLSDDDLRAIREREKSASRGRWKSERKPNRNGDLVTTVFVGDEAIFEDRWTSPEDAKFIAHARSDIPALIGEVVRLRALLDESGVNHD